MPKTQPMGFRLHGVDCPPPTDILTLGRLVCPNHANGRVCRYRIHHIAIWPILDIPELGGPHVTEPMSIDAFLHVMRRIPGLDVLYGAEWTQNHYLQRPGLAYPLVPDPRKPCQPTSTPPGLTRPYSAVMRSKAPLNLRSPKLASNWLCCLASDGIQPLKDLYDLFVALSCEPTPASFPNPPPPLSHQVEKGFFFFFSPPNRSIEEQFAISP